MSPRSNAVFERRYRPTESSESEIVQPAAERSAVESDSSGYPDCRPAYYKAFNEVVKAGTKEGKIEIVTPLIAMRKAEIVRLGLELGAPFDLTWSCYSRADQACGVCDSCVLLLRAFQAAGLQDPIPYAAR